jgi:arylsulfate sulfotransferase
LSPDWQRFIVLSHLFVSVIILCGCASGSSQSGPVFEQLAGFGVTPSVAVLEGGQSAPFTTTGSSGSLVDLTWKVNGVAGGSAASGTITAAGVYTAPSSIPTGTVAVTATNTVSNATTSPAQISFFSPKNFVGGAVSSSNNPQVALYSVVAPLGATVQVQFGTTTNYGLTTWAQPAAGSSTGVLVAGMRANTTYHMQGTLKLASGQQIVDADHTFATGDLPPDLIPAIAVPQAGGTAVAPGVELLDLFTVPKNQLAALATDLEGNVIWYYKMNPNEVPFPIKPLPNGHMLVVVSGGISSEIREIDLAGNVIYRLTLTDINAGLASIGASFQILATLHHDILRLPNGHLIILANYNPPLPDGVGTSTVTGDALVEWDPQRGAPVWTWSTFDHIPLTHAPYSNTDWTHSNAIIYSPDDGNLILSMRNQNWVIKINYQDGAGDGTILWTLGPGGDFALPSGQAPIEWNYGQHYPTVVSPNSAGILQLMFFNNGNNRLVDSANDVCGTAGFTPCYSSVPIFELNESAKTGQLLWETKLSPHYSICCGDALVLPNGNVEYDVAFDVNTPNQSFIQEVTQEQTPELLWQMNITGQLAYRGFRIPSLYPGVAWTQSAIGTANTGAVAKELAQTSTGRN